MECCQGQSDCSKRFITFRETFLPPCKRSYRPRTMATAAFSESAMDLAIRRAAEKFGYSKLRHQQVRAAQNFVQGDDVFVSLPTGSGKSLCYSILLATFDSLFGADGRHLARCILLSHRDNQILYVFRVNYHYVTAYRADPQTLAGAPRRNSPRDYVWFTSRPEEIMLEFVEIILFSNSFVFLNLCSTFLKIMLRYAYHIELKRQTCTEVVTVTMDNTSILMQKLTCIKL